MSAGESGAQRLSRRRCRKAAEGLNLSGGRSPGEVEGSQAVFGEKGHVWISGGGGAEKRRTDGENIWK